MMPALKIRRRKPLFGQGDAGQHQEQDEGTQPSWPFAIGDWRSARRWGPGSHIANCQLPIANTPLTLTVCAQLSPFCLLPSAFCLHLNGWSSSADRGDRLAPRSEEHTSELQSL